MFVQVIEGRTAQRDALEERFQVWDDELREGAEGFLGATVGVTDEGRFIAVVRFESEDAAMRNSERPEQGAWWEETERLLDGEPEFVDTTDTGMWHGGGSDEAGFVQVMRGRVTDPQRAKELFARFESEIRDARPDVLGSLVAWHDGDRFTQAVYFTDEATAREHEREGPPPEAEEAMAEFGEIFTDIDYLDLRSPRLQ